MKYHHQGISTKKKFKDDIYLEHLKVFVSGFGKNPYGVEWIRFEDGAEYPEIVRTIPHVAFEVDDIEEAIRKKNVIVKPNSPSPGIIVALIKENEPPIEFLQIDHSIAEDDF